MKSSTSSVFSLIPLLALSALSLLACGGDDGTTPLTSNDDDTALTGSGGTTPGNGDTGGAPGSGGSPSSGGGPGSGGIVGNTDTSACENAALVWKTGHKTNYTSYPDPGSVECIEYNGCMWEGLFAGCSGKQTEQWVAATNIAAVFPGFGELDGHQICVRSGATTMIVNVLDTCGDQDCDGCCTENKGDKDALIDLESYTNERWGLPDGAVEWADLGPIPSPCE